MTDDVYKSQTRIPLNSVINGVARSGVCRDIVECDRSKTFREEVEVLRTCEWYILRVVDLLDRFELIRSEGRCDVSHDIIRGRYTGPVGSIGPYQSSPTGQLLVQREYGDSLADAVLL